MTIIFFRIIIIFHKSDKKLSLVLVYLCSFSCRQLKLNPDHFTEIIFCKTSNFSTQNHDQKVIQPFHPQWQQQSVKKCGSRGGGGEGTGGPNPPRKSQAIWVSIGKSPPPPVKYWTPSGTLKNDRFL